MEEGGLALLTSVEEVETALGQPGVAALLIDLEQAMTGPPDDQLSLLQAAGVREACVIPLGTLCEFMTAHGDELGPAIAGHELRRKLEGLLGPEGGV